MRILIFILTFATLFNFPKLFSEQDRTTIYPAQDIKILVSFPKSFRYMNPAYSPSPLPTELGLNKMQASASSQFNQHTFPALLEKLPKKNITIIDLREESHGFVNGIAILWKLPHSTWTNVGMTAQQIEYEELSNFRALLNGESTLVNIQDQPMDMEISEVFTEKQLVESHHVKYMRIPVTEHHRPRDDEVDQFVKIMMNLTPEDWVHLHCRGGKGRTTLFLNMYDMLLNARYVSFSDILNRQLLLGGTDFFRLRDPLDERHIPAVERLEFLKQFYEYCSTSNPRVISWSNWRHG